MPSGQSLVGFDLTSVGFKGKLAPLARADVRFFIKALCKSCPGQKVQKLARASFCTFCPEVGWLVHALRQSGAIAQRFYR